MDKTIAYNVKTILKEKGIKQRKIAEILNVSEPEMTRLLNGERKFKASVLYEVSMFLDVDIETFFKGCDI